MKSPRLIYCDLLAALAPDPGSPALQKQPDIVQPNTAGDGQAATRGNYSGSSVTES